MILPFLENSAVALFQPTCQSAEWEKNPLFVTLKSGKEVEPSLLSFIYLFSTCEKDLNMRHLKPSIRGNA